jgi:hypothetical protein
MKLMLLKITARRDSTVSSSALHPAEVASKENISTISPNSLASNASLILTPPPPPPPQNNQSCLIQRYVTLELCMQAEPEKHSRIQMSILAWLMMAEILFRCILLSQLELVEREI